MAYINVSEWDTEQITDWLKGVDNCMYPYIQSFTNNQIYGHHLLNIRPYELENLGIQSIGHQEILLEAIEKLKNFHYNLDKENLQFLALQVAIASSSLTKQLSYCYDKNIIETQILNDITRTISKIKSLVEWLDRVPFKGNVLFNETKTQLLRLGLEMATSAQRDRFVENPVTQICTTAEKLNKLSDYIIQVITNPIILQPATLDLVTLKKRESELGFLVMPSYYGIHRIADMKYNSPAHNSGKIEEGDEIIQINYQTIIGWDYKNVIMLLKESTTDVLLTLKKRPKHSKMYGQNFIQRFPLPSKKRDPSYKWNEIKKQKPYQISINSNDNLSDSDSDDILTPADFNVSNKDLRLYHPKPRAVLQRRNTICGDQFSSFKNLGNLVFTDKNRMLNSGEESPSLRDKSISFGFGLEKCLEISKVSLPVIVEPKNKSVRFDSVKKLNSPPIIQPRLYKTPPAPPPRPKKLPEISKSEPLELLTPNKTKSLTLKKRSSILAKGRKITIKNLGTSDIQGHLYRRTKDKYGITYWAKLYYVLIDNALYSFKLKESEKADSLIILTGFTVAEAHEVHSKSNAFKVYHPKKTFYFAAENHDALEKWLDYIKQAIIKANTSSLTKLKNKNLKEVQELFTETESSDDDFSLKKKTFHGLATPSPASKKTIYGSQKLYQTNLIDPPSNQPTTPKPERYLGFNSFKKFKSSFSSNKSSDKKNELPVKTSQFKSYRKVPGHAGLQLGTNSMIDITSSLPPPPPTPTKTFPKILSRRISLSTYDFEAINETKFSYQHRSKKSRKSLPHNYIHCSNPNLVEFDFQTARTLDFSMPHVQSTGLNWDTQNNFQGLISLKNLMLQKKEEDEQEMYTNRVYLGVEKNSAHQRLIEEKKINSSTSLLKPVNKIQRRSLPKTPDYEQNFKPEDKAIIIARTKEGQKLRDFGYEFISGDDVNDENKQQQMENSERTWLRRNDRVAPKVTGAIMKKKKCIGMSLIKQIN